MPPRKEINSDSGDFDFADVIRQALRERIIDAEDLREKVRNALKRADNKIGDLEILIAVIESTSTSNQTKRIIADELRSALGISKSADLEQVVTLARKLIRIHHQYPATSNNFFHNKFHAKFLVK